MAKTRKILIELFTKWQWLIFFCFFLAIFSWQVFLKGYVVGPFDLLAGIYDPFRDERVMNESLKTAALHYKNPLLTDVVTVVWPLKLLAIDMIKNFEFPLWNPYTMTGSPLLANVQSSVLYPLNAIFFLLDKSDAFNIFVLLQPLLAFVFMFLYLRALKLSRVSSYFGALAFSFSAFFIGWLAWGTLGHAFLWLPLCLYASERFASEGKSKYAIMFVLSLVAPFFAGHTQTAVVVYIVTTIYILYRTNSGKNLSARVRLLFLVFVALLITSIQNIPSYEMYRESAREGFVNENFWKDQTLCLSSYLQAFFPDFFGNPVTRNWWGKMNYAESAIYFGTVAVYFLMYSLFFLRKKKALLFFFGVLLVGITLSTQNVLSSLFFDLKIPFVSSNTFSRFSILYIFGGTILSAFGFKYYLKDTAQNFKRVGLLNKIVLVVLIVYWTLVLAGIMPKEYVENARVIQRNSILPTILLVLVVAAGYMRAMFKKNSMLKRALPFVILLLLSGELFRFAYKYTPFSPRDFFYSSHKLITKLAEITQDGRYYLGLPANVSAYFRVHGIEGAEPLYNKRVGELASMGVRGRVRLADRAALSFPEGPHKDRVLDLMTAKYFVDKQDTFRNAWIDSHGGDHSRYDKRFSEIWTDGVYKIYRNRDSLDRAMLFYETKHLEDRDEVLKRMIENDFDYKNIVITDRDLSQQIKEQGEAKIRLVYENPSEQKYRVETTKPALLAVFDVYYPGWRVFVDGKSQNLVRVSKLCIARSVCRYRQA